MIQQAGPAGHLALLNVINKSWEEGKLPSSWKRCVIQPIPKPKDPAQPRPISLISCFGKTAEKMVKDRLSHQIGRLHPRLFAYREGVGAADNIAAVLGEIDNSRALVIFIDLEKAFELASRDAILQTLVKKVVRGRLLSWIQDYLSGRSAKVRFQGHFSPSKDLENGTPQGGILSPVLFNVLMENLVLIELGQGAKLFCYADDIQLTVRGNNKLKKAQAALSKIEKACQDLGLKINASKTKAMAINHRTPEYSLQIQGTHIDWVRKHQFLGVWFGDRLEFKAETEYLRERAINRIKVMRAITGTRTGADFSVLRLYYTHAVRSLFDYASPVLATLKHTHLQRLEVAQNQALRLMLGAPMWTRIVNLQLESLIDPIAVRFRKTLHALLCDLAPEGDRKISSPKSQQPEKIPFQKHHMDKENGRHIYPI